VAETPVEPTRQAISEPAPLPPSDTFESLPDDFWAATEAAAEATPAADPGGEPPRASSHPVAANPAPPAPSSAAAGAPIAEGLGIDVVQRLFPGRVVRVEATQGVSTGDDAQETAPNDDAAHTPAADDEGDAATA